MSADTIVPGSGYDPQMLNRFAYVRNNPLRYVDPTGHFILGAPQDDLSYIEEAFGVEGGEGGDYGWGKTTEYISQAKAGLNYFVSDNAPASVYFGEGFGEKSNWEYSRELNRDLTRNITIMAGVSHVHGGVKGIKFGVGKVYAWDVETGWRFGEYQEKAIGLYGGANFNPLSLDLSISENTPEEIHGPGTIAGAAAGLVGVDISKSIDNSATSVGISIGPSFGTPVAGYGFISDTDIEMTE